MTGKVRNPGSYTVGGAARLDDFPVESLATPLDKRIDGEWGTSGWGYDCDSNGNKHSFGGVELNYNWSLD
jgi:hypothetical protein